MANLVALPVGGVPQRVSPCSRSNLQKRRSSAQKQHATARQVHRRLRPGTLQALASLREALRALDANTRRSAIEAFKPHVRTALLAFMEQAENSAPKRHAAGPRDAEHGRGGMWIVRRHGVQKFKGRVYFGSLCLTTREQIEVGVAQDAQAILQRIRSAVIAEGARDPSFWEDNDAILRICRLTLEANGTSETALGLSACVIMRATQLLGEVRIVSPASTLSAALLIRVKLMRARATSWEALRQEWVALLQGLGRKHPVSAKRAEEIANSARHAALKGHLLQALRSVERGLQSKRGAGDKRITAAFAPLGREATAARSAMVDAKRSRTASIHV